VAQRIGRVVRKAEGKENALVYVVHVKDTKDKNIVKMVNAAIEKSSEDARPRPKAKRPTHGQKTIL
jgi:superfamily II DNA or RNA helicase